MTIVRTNPSQGSLSNNNSLSILSEAARTPQSPPPASPPLKRILPSPFPIPQPPLDKINDSLLPKNIENLEKTRLIFAGFPEKPGSMLDPIETAEIEKLKRESEELDRKKEDLELKIADLRKRSFGKIFDPKENERRTLEFIEAEIKEVEEAIRAQIAYGDTIDEEIRKGKAEVGLDISNFAEMASHEFSEKFGLDDIFKKIQEENFGPSQHQ